MTGSIISRAQNEWFKGLRKSVGEAGLRCLWLNMTDVVGD